MGKLYVKSVRYNGVILIVFYVFEGYFFIIWLLFENIIIIFFMNIFLVLNVNMKSFIVF